MKPDDELTAATPLETYAESGRPIAGGRWHVYADDRVRYEPPDGAPRDAVVTVATLRNDPGWTRIAPS